MAKGLSERIAERAKTKTPNQKAKNRAAFLAQREEIKQAMNDGWSVKAIWETLKAEGKVGYSYQAFTGYVNRLIREKAPDRNGSPTEPPLRDAPTQTGVATTAVKPAGIRSFTFNATPRKEDLL